MKNIFILCVMVLLWQTLNAQNTISGKITDQDHQPLIGATIILPELNKGTISDRDGYYQFTNLPNGPIKIQYSFVGFASKVETVFLNGTPVQLNTNLNRSVVESEEIVVTGGYNTTQHQNAVKIDVMKLKPEEVTITPNFMEALTKIPGVDMISKGSGVSKPVIRGLSMNDILVLNNGVRYENYQYSSHHPLGIDEFGIEDIEVIKGPASLLYGSDAIGGVLNFIKEKPALERTIVGDYNMQLFSNTLGVTNNLGIKGASKNFFWGIRAGQKTNSDFLEGGGNYVPNSRFNEYSVKTNAGTSNRAGSFKLYYDYNQQKLGLVEEEAMEGITKRDRTNDIFYQRLQTHLLSSQNKLYLGRSKLDVNAAFQNTELVHFGEPGVYEIQMDLATFTYETKLSITSIDRTDYIVGFQGMNQLNANLNHRETKLLPDATVNNYSAFALLQKSFFEILKLQTGLRYDYKTLTSKMISVPDSVDYRAALDKKFGSYSGSIGATLNLSDNLLLRANLAAGYRTPNLAELTSNGPHEAIYEVGDESLKAENSFEADVSIHYHRENFTLDMAGFYNAIKNYIYILPTSNSTPDGLPIYQYMQQNAVLYGGEAGVHYHPKVINWLHLQSTYAVVIGKQDNGQFLPFVPAGKLNFEVRVEKEKLLFFNKAFAALHTLTAFDQNNAAPDETPTPGYSLFDLTIGGNLTTKKQMIFIGLSANNLFDKKYVDHLSTLKEVNRYNPGRNIALTLKVPFGFSPD